MTNKRFRVSHEKTEMCMCSVGIRWHLEKKKTVPLFVVNILKLKNSEGVRK